MLEFDELEGLDDSSVSLFFGDAILVKAVGHVVLNGEGIEERRLLKDHADACAKLEEIGFAHVGDVLTEDADGAGVRSDEAVGELHQNGLSSASRAENDAGLAALDGEGDVLQDGLDVEGDGDVFEDDDRLRGVGGWSARVRFPGAMSAGMAGYLPKMPIIARVTSRSTMMMKMEETTTAWVVDLPTPWVPPLVVMPK